ncbi:MAG: Uma2 family endonuclease [Chloroflexota bacterium]
MALTRQRYTFEDWLALPDDGRRYELLNGELVEMPPPNANHGSIAVALTLWLGQAQHAGYGRVMAAPVAVILDAAIRRENAPEPDVFFVQRRREHIIRAGAVEGVPDLVIAILSLGNRRDDLPRGTKWDLYQRFAVPHYWIVDPEARTVTQYAYEHGHFGPPVLLGLDDTLAFPLAPEITLPVADLFRNLRPW